MRRYLFFILMTLMLFAVPAAASTHDSFTDSSAGILLTIGGLIGFGLVINGTTLTAIYRSVKTIYQEAFDAAEPQWEKIAMKIQSNAEVELYDFLGAFPAMREWVGERFIKNVKEYLWTIKNKDWESTVAIPRNKIIFDTYGTMSYRFKGMGIVARNHPGQLIFPLLNNGFTNKAYDNKAFFATDHEFGVNKVTTALSTTSYADALAKIGRFKDSDGNPLFDGSEKLTLCTGPELEKTARDILFSDQISVTGGSAQTNTLKNTAEYLKSSLITSATAWFIVIEFRGLKPFVFQEVKSPEFVAKEDAQNSDHVFMKKEYVYGVDSIDNAGYGLPQLCFGSTGAG